MASNLGFMAIAFLPLAWLATVMNFTGRGNTFNRLRLFLVIIPMLTSIFLWTNPLHHLFSKNYILDAHGTFTTLKADYGIWFWVHAVYNYILCSVSIVFLINLLIRSSRRYIGQPLTLLLGMLIPLVWNIGYIFGIVPNQRLDLTPYLYSLSGLIFLVGLNYSRLFDIVPVARDMIMDAMREAVIVVDYQGRVIDLNQSARRVFDWQADQGLLFQRIENIFAGWPTMVGLLRAREPHPVELVIKRDQKQFYYQASVAPVKDAQGNSLGSMLMLHDISDRKLMEEELRRLSVTDPLTELSNRRKFFTALDAEFARARRYHCEYCLIMLDLDSYKAINDRFSHLVGDEALKLAADAIRSTVRKTDLPARYGGDEFVVLLPNTSIEGAMQLAKRLREMIRQCRLSVGEHLAASLGVAVYMPGDKSSEDALARADQAMYQAKENQLGIVAAETFGYDVEAVR